MVWASVWGHVEIIELLIAVGAELSIQDCNGNTALMWADHYGHSEVAELLKEAGAKE